MLLWQNEIFNIILVFAQQNHNSIKIKAEILQIHYRKKASSCLKIITKTFQRFLFATVTVWKKKWMQ